jgi:hypothetical protein
MKRLAIALLAAAPFAAGAQSQAPDTVNDRAGMRAQEFWAGYSKSSSKWGVLGNRPGLSFAIAAARMTHRIKTTPGYALEWTMDIVPLALSSPPLGYVYYNQGYIDLKTPGAQVNNCLVQVFGCRFPNGSAYGAGVSPLGVTAIYHRDRMFQTRLGATGGILMFDRAVPTVVSTRFNFTATLEAGAQWLNRRGNGVLLVYRFHHISNAGTGYDNSALASHVISLGARWNTRRQ